MVKELSISPECIPTFNWKTNKWQISCNDIMKYGYPGNENIFCRDKYVFSYSFKHKQSNWVMEIIEDKNSPIEPEFDRSNCHFIPDPEIPSMFVSNNEDYSHSGYDRGHLAAYANHLHNYENNCSTFFLSNISPQVGVGFNRNIWEQLESHIRFLQRTIYNKVYCCTGILFLPNEKNGMIKYKKIGPNQVSVPTHFFKIFLGIKNNVFETECYIIPNIAVPDEDKLENFRYTIEDVERCSGLILFPLITRSDIIYANNEITVKRK